MFACVFAFVEWALKSGQVVVFFVRLPLFGVLTSLCLHPFGGFARRIRTLHAPTQQQFTSRPCSERQINAPPPTLVYFVLLGCIAEIREFNCLPEAYHLYFSTRPHLLGVVVSYKVYLPRGVEACFRRPSLRFDACSRSPSIQLRSPPTYGVDTYYLTLISTHDMICCILLHFCAVGCRTCSPSTATLRT